MVNLAQTQTGNSLVRASSEGLVRKLVEQTPGLGKSALPALNRFSELGFNPEQLEQLMQIAVDGTKLQGRATKLKWFFNAIEQTYAPDFLSTLPENFSRYKDFMENVESVEQVRADIAGDTDLKNTYLLCFDLSHKIGPERTRDLFESVMDYNESSGGREVHPVRALYIVKSLIAESEKTGCTPETLLDFRRGQTGYFTQNLSYDDNTTDESDEE